MTIKSIRVVNNDISISGQISLDDVEYLVSQGYKTILINRPDNEIKSDQPDSQSIKTAFLRFNIYVEYQPIHNLRIVDVKRFCILFKQCKLPILAYCKTGLRSYNLIASAQNYNMSCMSCV